MLTIKRDPPSQRLHFRLTSPAVAAVQNVPYRTSDWSLGGFRIENFEGDAAAGDRLTVQFGLNFHGFSIAFQTEVEVVRFEENRTLAARFLELKEREREVLLHFAQSVTAGEVAAVQDTLARMDIPVTPISTSPKPHEAPPLLPGRLKAKRVAFTGLYVAAGLLLAGYFVGLAYWRGFNVDVEYAVVSSPLYNVASLGMGKVREVLVPEGSRVEPGTPLVRVEDDQLALDVDAHRLALEQALAVEKGAAMRLAQERDRLGIYKDITRNKLDATRELLGAMVASRNAAQQQVLRLRSLAQQNAVSAPLVEQAEARLAELHGNVMAAQAELRIGESAQKALKYGSFYDSRTLVGDLPAAEVALAEARDQVRVAQQQVDMDNERLSKLTYRAPFSGRVVKLLKVSGTTVNRGEVMMVLEDSGALPAVDAYLTQDEVGMVQLGSKASVWVPALDKRWTGTVVHVDRTATFVMAATAPLKDGESRFNARSQGDRSAQVRLSLDGLDREAANALSGGLPALVTIPRRPAFLRPLWVLLGERGSAGTAVAGSR